MNIRSYLSSYQSKIHHYLCVGYTNLVVRRSFLIVAVLTLLLTLKLGHTFIGDIGDPWPLPHPIIPA